MTEPADWLAARVVDRPFGYTVFDLDPGQPGGTTRLEATHDGAAARSAEYEPVDRFTLVRPRADRQWGSPAAWPSPRRLVRERGTSEGQWRGANGFGGYTSASMKAVSGS
ncbi:MAG: hypothetical protein ACRD12_18960 [Acidimicrobiales bacterium]